MMKAGQGTEVDRHAEPVGVAAAMPVSTRGKRRDHNPCGATAMQQGSIHYDYR